MLPIYQMPQGTGPVLLTAGLRAPLGSALSGPQQREGRGRLDVGGGDGARRLATAWNQTVTAGSVVRSAERCLLPPERTVSPGTSCFLCVLPFMEM